MARSLHVLPRQKADPASLGALPGPWLPRAIPVNWWWTGIACSWLRESGTWLELLEVQVEGKKRMPVAGLSARHGSPSA